jgi:hypothetical protein
MSYFNMGEYPPALVQKWKASTSGKKGATTNAKMINNNKRKKRINNKHENEKQQMWRGGLTTSVMKINNKHE